MILILHIIVSILTLIGESHIHPATNTLSYAECDRILNSSSNLSEESRENISRRMISILNDHPHEIKVTQLQSLDKSFLNLAKLYQYAEQEEHLAIDLATIFVYWEHTKRNPNNDIENFLSMLSCTAKTKGITQQQKGIIQLKLAKEFTNSDINTSLLYYDKALSHFLSANDKIGISQCYRMIARSLSYYLYYTEAIPFYKELIKFSETSSYYTIQDRRTFALAISYCYLSCDEIEKSLAWYKTSNTNKKVHYLDLLYKANLIDSLLAESRRILNDTTDILSARHHAFTSYANALKTMGRDNEAAHYRELYIEYMSNFLKENPHHSQFFPQDAAKVMIDQIEWFIDDNNTTELKSLLHTVTKKSYFCKYLNIDEHSYELDKKRMNHLLTTIPSARVRYKDIATDLANLGRVYSKLDRHVEAYHFSSLVNDIQSSINNIKVDHIDQDVLQSLQSHLDTNKDRMNTNRSYHTIYTISGIFSILTIFGIIYQLFRRKKRILIDNILTDNPILTQEQIEINKIHERNLMIYQKIENLILEDNRYKDSDLTLDSIADELGTNRQYISQAINKVKQKNFNVWLNEIRINKLLVDITKHDKIDELSLQYGFRSKTTFYRVFKQIKGVSPNRYTKDKE